ncbi:hypothetical protein ACH4LK_33080 [Streptomyces lydicus]|uniref:hypothetical protein n=1 Tax=Streptomyces lydicus TaxID=47763 RepID=UPI0037B9D0B2
MTAPTPVRPPAAHTARPGGRAYHHPLYAELRSGPARWAALATFLTLLVPLVAKSSFWQGSWGNTQEQVHTVATLLGGPLAAAAGCWQGGRECRTHTAELRLTGARSPLAQFLVVAWPVAFGVLAGYLAAAAGALLASWPYVSAGRPLVLPPVADGVFLAAMTMLGTVVGRLARWRLAAPALAVCAYVALGVPTYQSSPVRFLSPAAAPGAGHSPLPVWWQPVAMAAWVGGLAGAAVLAYAVRRHRCTALLPLAVAAAAAVSMVQAGEGMWRPDPLGASQVCDDASPRVCVNALDRGLLPAVSHALAGITGRLDGVAHVPLRFEDLPRAPHSSEAQLPQLYLGQSVVRGELADPERFAWEAAAGLVARDCAAPLVGRTDNAVRDWLVSNGLSERRRRADAATARARGDDAAAAEAEAGARALARLRAMPDDRRRAWLGRYFATAGSCDPRGVPAL